MSLINFANILGYYLIWTGLWDAWKYIWEAQSIRKARTARGHSRKFINAAIHNDHIRIIYLIIIGILYHRLDWYLLSSSLLAVITMSYMWWTIYLYYPYRRRYSSYWKRPSLLIYVINSLIPNKIRRHL
jgi:hypothetical protein